MALTPGFMVLHGNQLEQLRAVLVQWMRSQPIAPLANEHILVQSNGIAQWLKMALAQPQTTGAGVAAGLNVELPNQFVWRLYRLVLGEQIPASLPYDKNNLTWRILRLLSELSEPVFAPLQRYLADDQDGRKAYHLAARLADLYDQYQVYRADWLQDWAGSNDVLQNGHGGASAVTAEQLWQPALWRRLRHDLAALEPNAEYSSRADVHDQALAALQAGTVPASALPERVIVFGISSLPKQTLALLAALGTHTQVVLAVLNPCRYFWGDISTARDELWRAKRSSRQSEKAGLPHDIHVAELHLHAPSLLASLGKQARDYLSLLAEFDQPEQYQQAAGEAINLFFHPTTGEFCEQADTPPNLAEFPLLHQLQQDILDLTPATSPRMLASQDTSISFHRCHSRQREVEVLHDHLLADFAANPELKPRDVIVMTPDIAEYAAHINAVFGRIERNDERFLPYALADQANRGRVPMLIALEYLLSLPEQRVTLNEVFDLLDVPAIQARLQLAPEVLPQLRLWLTEAGARWGIDSEHRAVFALGGMGDAYSWAFAIERMVLGYAFGEALSAENGTWQGRLPYTEMGGLSAADIGPVLAFIEQLKQWTSTLAAKSARTVAEWQQLMLGESGLLNTFFTAANDTDSGLLIRLQEALERVESAASAGHFTGTIQLSVLRDAWLAEAEQSGLSQKFMAGSITFSTLLPMRAIPFQRVYILGLNDGEYPRSRRADDFDLMQSDYRPGDRSRRDDDRYLFLEALLSAREALYLSWIGRSDRDNSEKTASVLVNQLRDAINQGWRVAGHEQNSTQAAEWLTHDYPLQPFSPAYFNGQYRTFAHEWEPLYQQPHAQAGHPPIVQPEPWQEWPPLTAEALQQFLRNPVRYYVAERLRARNYQDDLLLNDDEPFALDALSGYLLRNRVLQQALTYPEQPVSRWIANLRAEGLLPHAGFGELAEQQIEREVAVVVNRISADEQHWQRLEQPLTVTLTVAGLPLKESMANVYRAENGAMALLLARPAAVRAKGKPRWDTLVDAWLQQLLANAAGYALEIWQYGLDSRVVLAAKPQEQAQEQLARLVALWQQGLQQPLPVARKTSFTELAGGNAAEAYEGGFNREGELASSPEHARYYPDFASLQAAGFEDWSAQLYGPIQGSEEIEL